MDDFETLFFEAKTSTFHNTLILDTLQDLARKWQYLGK
jgi:hypothetical protein